MLDAERRGRTASDLDLSWVERRGVVTVPWPGPPLAPTGATRLEADHPVLFVLEPDAVPPPCDELQDWIRKPLDRGELFARADKLLVRSKRMAAHLILVDEGDVLRVGDWLVILSPLEARLVRLLVEHLGQVVPREALVDAAWPDGVPGEPRALDNRIKAIRSRIADLPLRLHTLRGRGLLLERLAEPDAR